MAKDTNRRKIRLKDGFYIEVKSKYGSDNPIKISRPTENEIKQVMKIYSKTKSVNYLGEVRDGKFVPTA